MTFGTCQVSDARVVFAPMESVIRKDSYRRSQVFTSLTLASLVGLFGLGYFLILHPTVCAMRVYWVYLTVLMTISQIITWDLKWAADPPLCPALNREYLSVTRPPAAGG
jgi:hypothetical protein